MNYNTFTYNTDEMVKNVLLFFMSCLSVLLISCSSSAKLSLQPKYAVATQIVKVSIQDKLELLDSFNAGTYSPLLESKIDSTSNKSRLSKSGQPILSLIGERQMQIFDVQNVTNSDLEYTIDLTSELVSDQILYKQVLLNDWYSSNPNAPDVIFIGDALLKLPIKNGKAKVIIKSKETVRLVYDFLCNEEVNSNISIIVTQGLSKSKATFELNVLPVQKPNRDFSSIIFNGINLRSNSDFNTITADAQLTHFQANYIPTVIFDTQGNPLTDIDHTTANSLGYRETVYPWIKRKGKIIFLWQARYKTLAPIGNGKYLEPYSSAWTNAFSNLLKLVVKDLKSNFPNLDVNDILLYTADEVSTTIKNDNINRLKSLICQLKNRNPEIRQIVTYGFFSSSQSVNELSECLDISCPHFVMPKSISKDGIDYYPRKVVETVSSLERGQNSKWAYQVTRGKTTDIREFLVLPVAAATRDFTGFSWYAFASHRGSTWIANDKNGLDYSMVYLKEKSNPIYNRVKGDDSSIYITSMRLKAARQGIYNSKLVLDIQDNISKLDPYHKDLFLKTIKKVSKGYHFVKSPINFSISLEELGEIDNSLRLVYSSLK